MTDWDDNISEVLEQTLHDLPEYVMETFEEAGALELFWTGFMDEDADTDERMNAREEFFDLMDEFLIDITEFDWDAWRDWYDS